MDEAVENKLGRVAFTLNALGPNPLKRGGAKQMPLLAIAQQAVLPAAVGAYLIHRFVIKRKKGQTGGAPAKSAAAAPEANGKPHPQSAQGKVKEKPRRHYKVKRELDDDAGRQEAREQMLQLMAQAGLVANGVADEDDEGEDEDEEGAEGQGQGQNSADFIRMLQVRTLAQTERQRQISTPRSPAGRARSCPSQSCSCVQATCDCGSEGSTEAAVACCVVYGT